ncbi:MAG: VIT domain-containing protein [Kofleriaceae bacterium]
MHARAALASLLTITLGCGGAAPPAPAPATAPPPATARTAAFAHAGTAALLAASTGYGDLALAQEAPMSLTASDGSGLELVKLEARAVVQGPLAFTELHLQFRNPEDRVREGTFAVTLPAGAAISRFAMLGDGGWMEAEVVERMAARRAYEDFLHRAQDPALLEQAEGNQFSARVFPIPARADKHLVISYSQELTRGDAPYVLPLRGLPTVGELDAEVLVATGADAGAPAWSRSTLSQRAWQPDRDFSVPVTARLDAVGHRELVAARVKVPGEQAQVPLGSLAILVDSSASRALGYQAQLALLGDTVAALRARYGDAFTLDVAAFDQELQAIYHGPAAGFGAAQLATLRARQALGASDLGAALAWVAASTSAERVLLIGDGVATAGADDAGRLAAARALGARGARRLDVALVGAIHDRAGARALAAAGLAEAGVVVEVGGAVGGAELARRLSLPVRSDLTIAVDGAAWTWPTTAAQAQPGDELVVYASLRATPAAGAGARVRLGDAVVAIAPTAVDRPLIGRAAAQAEIARLEAERDRATDAAVRAGLREQIVRVSVKQRVLSSETALLVLETDADYARFGIPRDALSDILVVTPRGLELQHRAQPVVRVVEIAVDDGDDVRATKSIDKAKKAANARGVRDEVPAGALRQGDAFDGAPMDEEEKLDEQAGELDGVATGYGMGAAAGGAPSAAAAAAAAQQPAPEPRRADVATADRPRPSRPAPDRRPAPVTTAEVAASEDAAWPRRAVGAPGRGGVAARGRSPRRWPPRGAGLARRGARRRAGAARARRGVRGAARGRAGGARLRLDHRSVPGPRRSAPVRRRAPGPARRPRRRAVRRHLRARRRRSPGSPQRSPPAGDEPGARRPRGRGVRGARGRARPALPVGPVRRRRADPARGSRPGGGGVDRARAGATRRGERAPGRGRRDPVDHRVDALRPVLGDRQQRRRLPHPRRPGRPRVLLEQGAAVGR